MVAAKAGNREIVELFKTKCHQQEPTEDELVRFAKCKSVVHIIYLLSKAAMEGPDEA